MGLGEQPVDVRTPIGAADLDAQVEDHLQVVGAARRLLPEVRTVGRLMCETFASRGVAYTFGNGGSAADAQHFSGELIGHYRRDRRPLPAVTLSADPSVLTCVANDYSFDDVFARQVTALARPGDVVVAFTTSGRSPNVVRGLAAARAKGASTVLFAGGDGGAAREQADHILLAPSSSTARVQETHTLLLHLVSELVDTWAAKEQTA